MKLVLFTVLGALGVLHAPTVRAEPANVRGARMGHTVPDSATVTGTFQARGVMIVSPTPSDLEPEIPDDTSYDWIGIPARRPEAIHRVLAELLAAPLGLGWDAWRRPMRERDEFTACREWKGWSEWSSLPAEYWVYQCRRAIAGGSLSYSSYLLGRTARPTLERVHWSGTERTERSLGSLRATYGLLKDSLDARLGHGRPVSPISTCAPGAEICDRVLEYLIPGKAAIRLFAREDSRVGLPLVIVERQSLALGASYAGNDTTPYALDESSTPGSWSGEFLGIRVARELAAAFLLPSFPEFARDLADPRPTLEQLHHLKSAVKAARGLGVPRVQGDAILLAAHLWLQTPKLLYLEMPGSGIEDDTAGSRRLSHELAEFGVTTYVDDGEFVVDRLVDTLAARAGTSAWADWAFWQLLDKRPDSTLQRDESEGFRIVIGRGEKFLREHPHSAAWWAIALKVAAAHETVWSLSKDRGYDGPGWPKDDSKFPDSNDAWDYVPEAPAHRSRALELYRAVRGKLPAGVGPDQLRERILRLELDVDTGCREFYNPGDEC